MLPLTPSLRTLHSHKEATQISTTISTKTIPQEVQQIVDALDDKRAHDIKVMDLCEVSSSLDYFIIATGDSGLQLRAMQDAVKEGLKEGGQLPKAIEGPSTRWILMDYGHIVIHLMSAEAREFYDLEGLWADAKVLEVTPS